MSSWKKNPVRLCGVVFLLLGGAVLAWFWLHRSGEDPTVYLPTPPSQLAEPLAQRYQVLQSFRVTVERAQARESISFFGGWERRPDNPRDRVTVSFQAPNRIRVVLADFAGSEKAIVAVCDGTSLWRHDPGSAMPAPRAAAELFDLVQLRALAALWRREWTKVPQNLEAACRASQEGALVRLRFVTEGTKGRAETPGRSWLDFRIDPAAKTLAAFESWKTHDLAIATARYGEIERYSDLVENPAFEEGEFKLPATTKDREGSPH